MAKIAYGGVVNLVYPFFAKITIHFNRAKLKFQLETAFASENKEIQV
ncbi:hypothetical protein [Lonepinella koalarum]|nr:hypothetical protein [Lonepinella koalarum]